MATEKRLIDANVLKQHLLLCGLQLNASTLGFVNKRIDEQPTVDAVEVVRCQNCQHSEPCKPYNKVWCPKMGRYMKQDGFCSEGVMKDG